VEIVSGVPFEKFLFDNVFSPRKMENTGFRWETRMNRNLFATGHDRDGKPVPSQPNIWAARGPGNLMTSVEDLYRLIQSYQDERFMPALMREKILQDYLEGKDTYSWNKKTTSRQTRFFHKGGGRPDFESQLMWYPDDDVVIIFCINNRQGLRSRLFSKIQSLMQ
jgi:CubicO group peptidase (beta-lactamase class C family)